LTDRDAPIFFGRQTQVDQLTDKVRRQRCVFVIGASGAGKSSLVWAGLVPNLINNNAIEGSRSWSWVRVTPGGERHPIGALARALEIPKHRASDIERGLRAGSGAVSRLVHDLLAKRPNAAELLLFVDQFEELFTIVDDSRQRAGYIGVLSRLIETKRVRVVATIRAEFIGHCMASEDFGEGIARWLSEGTFALTSPSSDSVREMVWRPAQRAGLSFDEGLVERIVTDTGSKPGNLPLMAFALERLYHSRSADGRMTWVAYQSFGGVEGAIADRASQVFGELTTGLGCNAEEALWSAFRELVEVDEETGTPVRRRLLLSRVPADGPERRLIDAFVDARLLVRGSESIGLRDAELGQTLEVAHEALFLSWPQLADWIEARRSHFALRQRLARDVSDWERLGRPQKYLWSNDRVLDAAVMARELGHKLAPLEQEFLGPIELEDMLRRIELDSTTHQERALIGERLALYGDPRPGVGLSPDGLPDILWLKVSTRHAAAVDSDLQEFWIAQYPVTCAQYRAYIDDRDGYANPAWWADLERGYLEPGGQFPPHGNHPAVNVLWCEAVSFCRWLSARTGAAIRLPTEQEWRFAATLGQRRIYPWGNRWRDNAANTDRSKLNRSVAVGLYPRGKSPVGALDMAGNVWEWCLNELGNPGNLATQGRVSRVTLGGSWNSVLQDVRVAHVGGYDFGYRNLNTGFRVVRTQ
jgi:formylglycine-generating enzyme required for sulfatase activity/energy-coupling factor transporter ATP-binding protein EcfA2